MVEQPEPFLRVVRGAPTDEELAALVAVLAGGAAGAGGARQVSPPSEWVRSSRPGATVGALPTHRGPHAWRHAALSH